MAYKNLEQIQKTKQIRKKIKEVAVSPAKIELNLIHLESKMVRFAANKLQYIAPFISIFLALYSFFIMKMVILNTDLLSFQGFFSYIYHSRLVLPYFFILTAVTIFMKEKVKLYFNFFCFNAFWIFSFLMRGYLDLPADVSIAIFLINPGIAYFTYLILRAKKNDLFVHKHVAGLILYFLLSLIYISYRLFITRNFSMLYSFWGFKFQYLILYALQIAYAYIPNSITLWPAIDPTNCLRIILWPVDKILVLKKNQYIREYWWRGALGVALGLSLILLKVNIDILIHSKKMSLISNSTLRYLLLLLSDIAVFNIICGSSRMFGYKVRDATYFSWLARSPADYWRRASVFHYEFIRRYIFDKLWPILKNRFFVLLISFSVFYLMKVGLSTIIFRTLISLNLEIDMPYNKNVDSHYSISLFILQFLSIYITSKYWFINTQKMNNSFYQWLSVVLTWGTQIGIFITASLTNIWIQKIL